jgi:hypothetical protein
MDVESNKLDRRNFLKTVGASGLGVVLAAGKLKADVNEPNKPKKEKEEKFTQVPKRVLGRTGVEVPMLALGVMFNAVDKQIVLKKAADWGVTLWDTSYAYAGGNSELGIGSFIAKNPDIRKDLFIVSKASGAKNIDDIEKCLQESLKRMFELEAKLHEFSDNLSLGHVLAGLFCAGFSDHFDRMTCGDGQKAGDRFASSRYGLSRHLTP